MIGRVVMVFSAAMVAAVTFLFMAVPDGLYCIGYCYGDDEFKFHYKEVTP